ncbi:MAG TPA: hypothetical protein VMF88_14970 [Bacteroidota bacterium]|nr:hypothetical protein [Bacteroidota bacterium]
MKFFFRMKAEQHKLVLLFLLLLTLPVSYQCIKAPLEPKAPSWQIPLNIQIIDRTFTFAQMIAKDKKFIYDSSTMSIIYQPSSLVNQPNAIVLPELTPHPAQVGNKIGLLQLPVNTISGVNVGASQLFSGNTLPFTYPSFGPNFSLAMQQPVSNPSALYDWISFQNGRMTLTVQNNFQFTVNFANPGVQLINTDMLAAQPNDSVVATFLFPGGIAPGTTGTATAVVSGLTMSSNLILRFTVQSNDIQGKTINASDDLSASMTVDGGSSGTSPAMDSAKVQLNTPYDVKNLPDSSIQIVDDSTLIKRAEFKDGKFTVSITNNIPTKIAVDFAFQEFVDKTSGVPFVLKDDRTLSDTVPAAGAAPGQFLQTVSMANYAIQSQSFQTINGRLDTLSVANMHFSLRIRTLAATQGRVVIRKTDSVQVQITPQNNNQVPPRPTYIISKVIGKVKPTVVAINTTVPSLIGDISNKFTADSIKFDSVSITLNILSTGLFPTDLTMKVIGIDNNGNQRATLTAMDPKQGGGLTDTLRIYPGQTKKIVFNKQTSQPGNGIDQFLSAFFSGGNGSLPTKFQVIGQAVVDPASYYQYPDSTGTVKQGDSVYTSLDFSFPVTIGIINGTFKDTVVMQDSSGNKVDKKDLTQIDSGQVSFTIVNGFPLQITAGMNLLPALKTNRSQPDTTVLLSFPKIGLITADSARYASKPNSPLGITGTVIGLDTADVSKINPASFAAVTIRLNTSGSNQPVKFDTTYSVELKAFLSVRFNVNFDQMK